MKTFGTAGLQVRHLGYGGFVIFKELSHAVSICRRLFPTLRVRVHGLTPSTNYVLLVDVVPVDQFRYRYEYSTWFIAGVHYSPPRAADARQTETSSSVEGGGPCDDVRHHRQIVSRRCYVHPDSPATGQYWMRQSVISFYRLKLTNNISDQHGSVYHKHCYHSVVHATIQNIKIAFIPTDVMISMLINLMIRCV